MTDQKKKQYKKTIYIETTSHYVHILIALENKPITSVALRHAEIQALKGAILNWNIQDKASFKA